jgi:type II secretory pathway predicted ATPase ExeA
MIDKLQTHYGFTRMPFGRDLAPGMLHRHAAHNEAVARITWCIAERAIGVITGEVGAGKTASVRTVLAGLDNSRHTIIYLPNPMIGVRGLHEMIVATFGGQPDRSGSRLTAQASAVLAAERDERGKTPVLVIDEAHLLRYEQLETIRMLTNHNLDADSPLAALLVGQPTLRRTMKLAVLAALEQRVALRYAMPPMTSQETTSYITPPPQARRPRRHPVQRRRCRAHSHHRPRLPPRRQQPRPPGPRRHLRRRQSHRRRERRPRRRHRSHRHINTGTSPTTTGTITTKAPQPPRLRGLTAPPHVGRQCRLRRNFQRRATPPSWPWPRLPR